MSEALDALKKIEEAAKKYDDVIGNMACEILKEENLSSDKLAEDLEAIAKEGRSLNVGIVGRVKSGKSSLLNSLLFDGKDTLPKAATPMTAALTILSYGETFEAKVSYFSKEDRDRIAEMRRRYEQEYQRVLQEKKKDLEEKAKKKAEREKVSVSHEEIQENAEKSTEGVMKNHSTRAAFEQHEMMQKSPEALKRIGINQEVVLTATDVGALMGKMEEYVGASGKMMPFTKSVELACQLESLKDLSVVDTPGVNDPVVSREERTKEYLGKCDVVFVISPAGQFLSFEDTNLIDRIGRKEGVQELFLLATQADTQLHGDKLAKNNGCFPDVLESIREELSTYAEKTFCEIKKKHPEVGTAYDPFINQERNSFLLISGICHALLLRYDQKDQWDPNMTHVWSQLQENYPDYFAPDETAKTNLAKLANLDGVKKNLEYARNEKARIQEERRQSSLAKAQEKVDRVKAELLKNIGEQITLVKETSEKDLQERKKNLEMRISKGSEAVDSEFEDLQDEFAIGLKEQIEIKVNSLFTDTEEDVSGKEQEKSREVEKPGFIPEVARFLGLGGYENQRYTEIKTGPVLNRLKRMTMELENEVEVTVELALSEWKKKMQKGIIRSLRESTDDDAIDVSQLKKALRKMINDIDIPDFDYFSEEKLKKDDDLWGVAGSLENSECDNFMTKAGEYIIYVKCKFRNDVKEFLEGMKRNLSKQSPSGMLFDNMKNEIETLGGQIKEKKITIDRLTRAKNELS